MDFTKAIEISENIFWIGMYIENDPFQCHPYFIKNGDESILIDPGSMLEFDAVVKKVSSISSFKNVKYIILQHQDPDLCASVANIEKLIDRQDLKIITHSRMSLLIKHYNVTSPFLEIDKIGFNLATPSGLKLEFLTTPYCHSPGAFVTYEPKNKVLFSSDLFGGLSESWDFFANENYFDNIKAFHSEYMPSKDILNYALTKIQKLDINLIAPQHGSIIEKKYIFSLIKKMKELECGIYIERKYHEELVLIKENKDFLNTVIESNNSAIIAIDNDQLVQIFNRSAQEMFGYSKEEMLGKDTLNKIIPPNYWKKHRLAVKNYILSNKSTGILGGLHNLHGIRKNGEEFPIQIGFGVTHIENKTVIVANILDMTTEEEQNNKLKEQKLFLQNVIDGISDKIRVLNIDYSVGLMNRAAKEDLKTSKCYNKKNPKCYELFFDKDAPCEESSRLCSLKSVLASKKAEKFIQKYVDLDNKEHFIELMSTPLKDANGDIYAIIEVAHDITSHLNLQKKLQKQNNALAHQANHDALTNLPNRVLFFDRLEQSIKDAKREKNMIAILFLDLDHFKEINDSLGHAVGDTLLKEVSYRLKSAMREADTIARLGGDEFATIINSINNIESVVEIANKILMLFQDAIIVNEHELYITCSIGISIYPNDGNDPQILLRDADSAMYKAKNEGRNSYQFYTSDMTERALERISMETNLRKAIENDELVVHYQPQFNVCKNKLLGMEALVRWQNPKIGLIQPDRFIPLAEEIGLVVFIDRWVMEVAMKQVVLWKKNGLKTGRMALNVSMKNFQAKDFIEKFCELLVKTKCTPENIELEITESNIMQNPEKAIVLLQKLKDMGVKLAVDDFGTGYSSLAYLKRLPIDKLKIDRSFILGSPNNDEDFTIAKMIISMSKSLKLDVIAEGVETDGQKKFLMQNGCISVQGYLFGLPVPAKDMQNILKKYTNAHT